jgi:hypothetical protein
LILGSAWFMRIIYISLERIILGNDGKTSKNEICGINNS